MSSWTPINPNRNKAAKKDRVAADTQDSTEDRTGTGQLDIQGPSPEQQEIFNKTIPSPIVPIPTPPDKQHDNAGIGAAKKIWESDLARGSRTLGKANNQNGSGSGDLSARELDNDGAANPWSLENVKALHKCRSFEAEALNMAGVMAATSAARTLVAEPPVSRDGASSSTNKPPLEAPRDSFGQLALASTNNTVFYNNDRQSVGFHNNLDIPPNLEVQFLQRPTSSGVQLLFATPPTFENGLLAVFERQMQAYWPLGSAQRRNFSKGPLSIFFAKERIRGASCARCILLGMQGGEPPVCSWRTRTNWTYA